MQKTFFFTFFYFQLKKYMQEMNKKFLKNIFKVQISILKIIYLKSFSIIKFQKKENKIY